MAPARRRRNSKSRGESQGETAVASAATLSGRGSLRPEDCAPGRSRCSERTHRESLETIQEAIRATTPRPAGATPDLRRVGSSAVPGCALGRQSPTSYFGSRRVCRKAGRSGRHGDVRWYRLGTRGGRHAQRRFVIRSGCHPPCEWDRRAPRRASGRHRWCRRRRA